MSGGSLDYVYYKVEEAAMEIRRIARSPLQKAFATHLLKVSHALKATEWCFSGDGSAEDAEVAIRDALGNQADKAAFDELKKEAEELIKQLTKFSNG